MSESMKKEHPSSLVMNFVYNVAYQIMNIFLPLVTVPYVSRVLGAEKLGIYSYTYAIASYFAIVAYLGFENYGNRMIARNRENREKLDQTFSGAYYFQLISGFCACGAYVFYLLFFCRQNRNMAFLQLLYIVSQMVNISWLYFGLEKFKKTALRSMSVKLLSTAAIFVFVKGPGNITEYTLICAGSALLGSGCLWINLHKSVSFVKVSLREIFIHAKGCMILFFPVLIINIYRSMDKIMLGQLADMKEVAVYSNADKIVELPYGIIAALGVVMLPRMTSFVSSGEVEKSRKYIEDSMRFMLFMACGMAFGMMAVGRVFAPVFFGDEFISCGDLIMTIAPMVIIRACANVVRTQYLLPNNRDKDYMISLIIGVIINLTVNWGLIPILKSQGAAIGTLMAESFVAIYQIAVCRKEIPVIRYTLQNWFFLIAGAVMFFIVFLLGNNQKPSVVLLIVQICTGGILYILLAGGYLLKNRKVRKDCE